MKLGFDILKCLKPTFLKKTITVRFGWTRGKNPWTSEENAMDESERG
jgi:hypothetical protein